MIIRHEAHHQSICIKIDFLILFLVLLAAEEYSLFFRPSSLVLSPSAPLIPDSRSIIYYNVSGILFASLASSMSFPLVESFG